MIQGEYLKHLKRVGVRLTPQRQEILQVRWERAQAGGQPVNAEEVMKRVRERYPGVSLDTVYRTLATFTRKGIVNELQFKDQSRRYELVIQGEHHHHLVCLRCGFVREIAYCPEDIIKRVRESHTDFKIEEHSFTIYGYCAECRED